jgi:microcin C transport system permease protein
MRQAMSESGGGGAASLTGELALPQEAIDQLKEYYKLDKPIWMGYLIWLGVWPDHTKDGAFSGVLQGDFGISYRYSESVLDTIVSKFPISIYFGLIGYLLSWMVCIPLGIKKALKHRSLFDTASSIVVFVGYSIPGFVAALVLMLFFATDLGWNIFPLGGFRSEGWDEMWAKGEIWWCIKDQINHTVIPIIGYVLASFATMTILMKNSLLDNLGADYVRTAFAKGLRERRVIYLHALRNSLIPICVGIGHAIGLLFAGSFLIEKTCNIPGMGLLGYNSLIERDYPVLMGILVFLVLIRLTGNLLSDLVLALVDPRVRFH